MRNSLTIARKELGVFFNSPIAYVVITVFLLTTGYLYFSQLFIFGEASMREVFSLMPLIFILLAPAITMRMLAEEKRTKTIELLITMPVKDHEVIIGKFLAAWCVITVAVLLTLPYPITVSFLGELDWGPVFTGYLGVILLGAVYVAVGLMTSSWTRDQVVAFIIAAAITFALFLFGKMLPYMPVSIAAVVEYVSLDAHFESIAKGVIDTRDVLYYLSWTTVCLFMATQSLDSRRWR